MLRCNLICTHGICHKWCRSTYEDRTASFGNEIFTQWLQLRRSLSRRDRIGDWVSDPWAARCSSVASSGRTFSKPLFPLGFLPDIRKPLKLPWRRLKRRAMISIRQTHRVRMSLAFCKLRTEESSTTLAQKRKTHRNPSGLRKRRCEWFSTQGLFGNPHHHHRQLKLSVKGERSPFVAKYFSWNIWYTLMLYFSGSLTRSKVRSSMSMGMKYESSNR